MFAVTAATAASWALWQYRFVEVPGQPALTLDHLPAEVTRTTDGSINLPAAGEPLVMDAAPVAPRVQFRWTAEPASGFVHIVLEAGCENVTVGTYPWDDARMVVVWFNQEGKRLPDFLPVWSKRGTEPVARRELILPLARTGGLPCLMIENLGSTGRLTLRSLAMQAIVQRPWVPYATTALLGFWALLLCVAMRRWISPQARVLPMLGAAGLCIAFTWFSAFPGPWVPWFPVGKPFAIAAVKAVVPPAVPAAAPGVGAAPSGTPVAGTEVAGGTAPAPELPSQAAPAFPAEAKGPPGALSGGAVRWLWGNMPSLKRVIHFMAFSGVTALLALLTGSRRAGFLSAVLAALSEFCQWAYGFGFDAGDVVDLVMDGLAIAAGLAAWALLLRWLQKRQASSPAALEA